MDIQMFLSILGLGVAIPFTLVMLINIIIKVREGSSYQIDMLSLGKVYITALLGWALFVSTILGG